jgi:hypothetical protein
MRKYRIEVRISWSDGMAERMGCKERARRVEAVVEGRM